METLAERRLLQIQELQHEANRLRVQVEELTERPVGEEQLRSNPKFVQLQTQAQHWSEQARQCEQSLARLRAEHAELNKARHAEMQRFESMRMQQREDAGQETQRAAKLLAQVGGAPRARPARARPSPKLARW